MLHACLSSADFFQNQLFQKIIWLSNRLDPDQTWHCVEPDLGLICLQGFEQTTKVGKQLMEIVNTHALSV